MRHGTQIDRPIFIVGPGRSGTTLLLKLLAGHGDLAWFSGYTDRFPSFPQLAFLSRMDSFPFAGQQIRLSKGWPKPAEANRIWDSCFPHFLWPSHDLGERECTAEGAAKLRSLVATHLVWQGRRRFLTKYTGYPRFGLIRRVFPDALFVHIDRDPRAVVFSWMKQRWMFKKKPDEFRQIPVVDKLRMYSDRYLAIYEAKKQYREGADYHQIYYENLIRNPLQSFQELCTKTDLSWTRRIERRITSWHLDPRANQAWPSKLTSNEQECLSRILREPVEEMGYDR